LIKLAEIFGVGSSEGVRMKILTRMSVCLTAGAFGALTSNFITWLAGKTHLTFALGVRFAPRMTPPWLYRGLVWGALWALIFLALKVPRRVTWGWILMWGCIVSLAPTFAQFLYFYPSSRLGYFGIKLGSLTPLFILFFNAIWGCCAALWVVASIKEYEFILGAQPAQPETTPKKSKVIKPPKGQFCQSCGMSLAKPEICGTNADGSRSRLYCNSCYQDGNFTQPDITIDQMIDKVAGIMAEKMNIPEDQAKEKAKSFIPALKRWRGG